jgi:membrane-bound ClpP family serine protease
MSFLWIPWMLYTGLTVAILAAVFLTFWMMKEYLSLPGHFNVSNGLIGQVGTVKKECTPHQKGKVYVAGAYWDAISEFGALREGDDIKVVEVKDKFLLVGKVDLINEPKQ